MSSPSTPVSQVAADAATAADAQPVSLAQFAQLFTAVMLPIFLAALGGSWGDAQTPARR